MRDYLLALKVCARAPRGIAAAVLSIAAGMCATVALLSVSSAVMSRPLPVDAPEQLLSVAIRSPDDQSLGIPVPLVQEIAQAVEGISGAAGYLGSGVAPVSVGGSVIPAVRDAVSGNFFHLLGVRPFLGRLLDPADSASKADVVVLSYRFWQQHLGGEHDAIGRGLRVGEAVATIVGVTPEEYCGIRVEVCTDVTVPDALLPRVMGFELPPGRMLAASHVVVRRNRDSSRGAVQASLNGQWRWLVDGVVPPTPTDRRSLYENSEPVVERLASGLSYFRERYESAGLIALALAAWLLVAAAINVTGVMMLRTLGSADALAIQQALGATMGRLFRYRLAEALLVAACGSTIGGLLGVAFARFLAGELAADFALQASFDVSPDWVVYITVAFLIGIISVGVAGFVTWVTSREANSSFLLNSGYAVPARGRVVYATVVVQIALTMLLVATGVQLSQHLFRVATAETGLQTRDISVVRLGTASTDLAAETTYYQTLLQLVGDVPGVERAGLVSLGFAAGASVMPMQPVQAMATGQRAATHIDVLSPGVLGMLNVPVRAGRDFAWQDQNSNRFVAIVTTSLARALFGSNPAVGQRIRLSDDPGHKPWEVVGVVADVTFRDPRERAPRHIFLPHWALQDSSGPRVGSLPLLLLDGAPAREEMLRQPVDSLARHFVLKIERLEDRFAQLLVTERVLAALGAICAMLAMVLMGVGLYGAIGLFLQRRTKEFGIRLALGASPRTNCVLLFRNAGAAIFVGCAAGAFLMAGGSAVFASRFAALGPLRVEAYVAAVSLICVVAAATVAVRALALFRLNSTRVLREPFS